MAKRTRGRRTAKKDARAFDSRLVYFTFFFLAVWVVVCSAVYVWCQKEVTRTGYETSRALAVQKKLMKANRALKVEVAMLSSPERIERIAREKLDMIHPGVDRKIILK